MSGPVETLKKARANLVTIRLRWAEVLAQPFELGKTEKAVGEIVQVQQAIDVIDRAIAEERKPITSSQELRM